EIDGAAIAINEKRFATDLRNVIAADEFGPMADGNVGELLKHVPGVALDYVGGAAMNISLNGVPAGYVPVTVPVDLAAGAEARITRLRHRRKGPPAKLSEGAKLSARVANKAVVIARRGTTALPVPLSPETLIVVPDFKEVRERFTFEGGHLGPEALARRLSPGCTLARSPITTTELGRLPELARRAKSVIFLSFEARRFPGQAAALRLLAKTAASKTVAILIRSSWDLDLCPRTMTVVDAAGYRLVSLEAALSRTLTRRKS
ncbi:MAG: hypothetical protein ABL955_07145, partial [Elusimicrobiota bacterium]